MTGRTTDRNRDKRNGALDINEVGAGNVRWWSANPMAYDWCGEIQAERGSAAWFDEVDARFIHGARLFGHKERPFDRIVPFEAIAGQRVLEIGCGMGLHTELMLRAGARLTSIDISPTSVAETARRLELKGLKGDVKQMDAERLSFANDSFDFVWSWGVIHHAPRTGRIVREICRVLRPDGETRTMVYNRDGLPAWAIFWRRFVLGGGFRVRSLDEELFRGTDGFMARYYTRDQLEDLFRTFFDEVEIQVMGQEADSLPLPRKLRAYALNAVSREYLESRQAKRGGFLFLTARIPG